MLHIIEPKLFNQRVGLFLSTHESMRPRICSSPLFAAAAVAAASCVCVTRLPARPGDEGNQPPPTNSATAKQILSQKLIPRHRNHFRFLCHPCRLRSSKEEKVEKRAIAANSPSCFSYFWLPSPFPFSIGFFFSFFLSYRVSERFWSSQKWKEEEKPGRSVPPSVRFAGGAITRTFACLLCLPAWLAHW